MGLAPRRHRPAPGGAPARGGCLGRAAAPSTGAGRGARRLSQPGSRRCAIDRRRAGRAAAVWAAPLRHQPVPGGAPARRLSGLSGPRRSAIDRRRAGRAAAVWAAPRRHRPAPGGAPARGGCLGCLGRAAAPSTGAGRGARRLSESQGLSPQRHRPAPGGPGPPGGARGGCLSRRARDSDCPEWFLMR